jgi:hypothetical protein
MAKHVRARKAMLDYIKENGNVTTWQIHDYLKDRYRNGPTINCLGNLLGKHPEVYMISRGTREETLWRLK